MQAHRRPRGPLTDANIIWCLREPNCWSAVRSRCCYLAFRRESWQCVRLPLCFSIPAFRLRHILPRSQIINDKHVVWMQAGCMFDATAGAKDRKIHVWALLTLVPLPSSLCLVLSGVDKYGPIFVWFYLFLTRYFIPLLNSLFFFFLKSIFFSF